ncbi:peroxiredoxin-like family protein [Streptomyces flaveolus]|uniref:peroxiredoxin-like family protein n=1 Tax=Streptomyces flaveolus TaxID=67297 RepID=UPI0033204A82
MHVFRGPVEPGSTVNERRVTTVSGEEVAVPAPDRLTHLQFRRFAGCPVCNLHLRSVVRRHAEIEAAGVREVVVFHSPADELLPHTTALPFAVVADPGKRLYTEFGVERSPRALLDPRAWGPIARAVLSGVREVTRGRERLPSTSPHGGRLGLPADFLIASDGRVLAAKYGEHVYDQWSVDELLELAARTPRTPRTNPSAR